jgi:hypothetical protein
VKTDKSTPQNNGNQAAFLAGLFVGAELVRLVDKIFPLLHRPAPKLKFAGLDLKKVFGRKRVLNTGQLREAVHAQVICSINEFRRAISDGGELHAKLDRHPNGWTLPKKAKVENG